MPELSIIIVNYKNQDLILQCVQSIIDYEPQLSYEIIVVDNHSEDDSEEKLKTIYPELTWIPMTYNSGFGRANNKGIAAANGEYILLLNSDVIVKDRNTIFNCLEQLKSLPEPNKTVLGTRLINEDGSFQETLRLKFPGIRREFRANAFYILIVERLLKRKSNAKEKALQKEAHFHSGEVEWINGAFLLMNLAEIKNQELFFDSDFFLYGEDVEWCWRAKKSGMKFYHWQEQELIHIGSASAGSFGQKKRFQQIQASDWLYLKKTRGSFYTFLTMMLVCKNQLLDSTLYFLAKLRRKSFSDSEKLQRVQRKWTYENLKRFYYRILFLKNFSDKNSFVVNCYSESSRPR